MSKRPSLPALVYVRNTGGSTVVDDVSSSGKFVEVVFDDVTGVTHVYNPPICVCPLYAPLHYKSNADDILNDMVQIANKIQSYI